MSAVPAIREHDYKFPQLVRVQWRHYSSRKLRAFSPVVLAVNRLHALQLGEAVAFCMIPPIKGDIVFRIQTADLGRVATLKDAAAVETVWATLRKDWL